MDPKQTCPECGLAFEAPPSEAGLLSCPLCEAHVPAPPSPAAAGGPPPAAAGRHALTGVVAVGALVFVIGGLVYAYQLLPQDERKPADRPTTTVASRPAEAAVLTPTLPPLPINPAPPSVPPARPVLASVKPPAAPPPDATPAAEPLPARVNRAIDLGLANLRKDWGRPTEYRAYLGLLGLTLLECGVPRNDPAVVQIATLLRARRLTLNRTYELSLAILFFDRLGYGEDSSIIQTFAQRLLDGQSEVGLWNYTCPVRKEGEPLIEGLRFAFGRPPALLGKTTLEGDNSNTQFAILGLWVAQRHAVSAAAALDLTGRYFRNVQHGDGSWTYPNRDGGSRPSMTCAGLIGLAVEYGVKTMPGKAVSANQAGLLNDSAAARGLEYLGGVLNRTSPERGEGPSVEGGYPLYFLWSLERTAVIYSLDAIGDKEWYPWAAEWLVAVQRPDGSWQDGLPRPVATCLALLVLKRSNVTLDLVVGAPRTTPGHESTDPGGPIILQGAAIFQGPGGAPDKFAPRDGAAPPDALNGYIAPLKK